MSETGAHDSSELEDLIVRCLERLESDGERALEELCAAHPAHAARLRERIASLRRAGLVGHAVAHEFPERLGDFKLLERLGAGGMGVVYRALQESLGREVALKLIRPEQLYFGKARERFEREVAIVAKLHHPGIVPIYTVGEASGIPYFAMERVDGESLADLIHELAPLPARERNGARWREALARGRHASSSGSALFAGSWSDACVAIAREIAEALEHAHRRGVLHRDVKPSNVMLTRDGRVMLLDFGLSASVDAERVTRTGAQLGSLPHMAPEQIRGQHESIDARTDVYQLGVTLFELLTTHLPFEGRSSGGLAAEILAGHAPRMAKFDASIEGDVETVCRTAMDPDPARRYASAGAFARDLDHLLARRPIEAQRARAWVQARRWAQRHKGAAVAVALGACLFIGTPTALYVQQRAANRTILQARQRAEDNFDSALAAVELVTRVGEETMRDLPRLEPARRRILEGALAFYVALAEAQSDDAGLALQIALARGRVADMQALLGQFAEAEREYGRELESLRQLESTSADREACREARILALHARASVREQLDDFAGSRDDAREALALLERDQRPQARSSEAAARFTLGNAFYGLGDWDQARAAFELGARQARRALELAAGDERALEALAKNVNALGVLAIDSSRPEEALPYLSETVELDEQRLARSPEQVKAKADVVDARTNLGLALSNLGRHPEAGEVLRRAVELQRELLRDFPDTARNVDAFSNVVLNLGVALHRGGDPCAALAQYREAIEHQRQLAQRNDAASYASLLANLLSSCGAASIDCGELEPAGRMMDEALEWQERAVSRAPDQPLYVARLAEQLLGRAELPRRAGRHAEAAALVARALQRSAEHDWIFARRCAGRLAQCAELARDDLELLDTTRAELSESYAAQSLAALRLAFERGYRDLEDLRNAAVFNVLRDRAEFAALERELAGIGP
ncbi:MAG: serine/threonine protein kinase [Planctomycetes bacterium]|nr:serine/threonine protein kinase [Planctomycetota bacterium]